MDEFEPNGKQNRTYFGASGLGSKNRTYYGAKQYSEIGPYGGSGKKKSYSVKMVSRVQEGVKTIAKGLAVAAAGIIIVEASTAIADPESFARDFNEPIGTDPSPSSINELITSTEDHIWDEGVVIRESTCSEKGEKVYTCKICDETKTEELPLVAHTEEIQKGSEASCTKAGHTDVKVCSVCGKVLDEGEDIPALGHDWGAEYVAVNATCYTAGYMESKCNRCGEIRRGTAIGALGHYDGNGDYRCDRCGLLLVSIDFAYSIGEAGSGAASTFFRVTGISGRWYAEGWPTTDLLGMEGGWVDDGGYLDFELYFHDSDLSPQSFEIHIYDEATNNEIISAGFQVSGQPNNLTVIKLY